VPLLILPTLHLASLLSGILLALTYLPDLRTTLLTLYFTRQLSYPRISLFLIIGTIALLTSLALSCLDDSIFLAS
jgi:hypothetical protein